MLKWNSSDIYLILWKHDLNFDKYFEITIVWRHYSEGLFLQHIKMKLKWQIYCENMISILTNFFFLKNTPGKQHGNNHNFWSEKSNFFLNFNSPTFKINWQCNYNVKKYFYNSYLNFPKSFWSPKQNWGQ